ncbi:MAG: 2TM domain-containing protein [Rhodoferax sp.]|nr:2TM domain-containing protein [Rhodoferax sp.]
MTMNTLSATDIERLAHKRAGARMGLYVHATVYLLVNLGLWTIALLSGRHWAVFPTLGWGLGLLIHAAIVLLAMPGASFYQRLLQQERARLQTQRDPW